MIKAVSGTRDILPSDIGNWIRIEQLIRSVMSFYNYSEIRPPIFEETSLFARGIGENTDIVSKEMYTFTDRSGDSITLRPEMTAGVIRAFIEHSLDKKQSLNKLFYIGPMFRQERPQAGRFRQFHQFGAEAIGSNDPLLDAEMIIIAFEILKNLGLKNLSVKINSLGVPESREEYKKVLRNYLQPHLEKLSEDSRKRMNANILRIFDSKDERDKKIMDEAPLLIEHLDELSLEHFDNVKKTLAAAQISYEIDAKLVRGLDYYTHTTFEIASGSVGSQNALCGGGRYNGLVKELGGNDLPGVGFASGLERVLLACENERILPSDNDTIDLYIVLIDKQLKDIAFKKVIELRRKNIKAEIDYLSRSVKAQMRDANRMNTKFVLFIGGEEFQKGEVILKNMLTGNQININKDDLDRIHSIVTNASEH